MDGHFWYERAKHPWLVILEPYRECSGKFFPGRSAEGVRVIQVKAYCSGVYHQEELMEGFIYSGSDRNYLFPVCGSLREYSMYESSVKYHFKITEDGQVLFSQL